MTDTKQLVQFAFGSWDGYNSLDSKDQNTLYFITDQVRLMFGDKEFTRPVQHGTALPEGFTPPNSFFLKETGEDGSNTELYYSKDGTSWEKVAALPKTVQAGSYGPTVSETVKFGGTITIPQITIDANGYATAGKNQTITLPTETPVTVEDGEAEGNAITAITAEGHKITLTKGNMATAEALAAVKTTADAAMPKSGGTFTGPIVITAPSEDMHPTTKAYVDAAIKAVTQFNYQIVDSLPESGEKGTIYLVKKEGQEEKNIYEEYIWVVHEEQESFEKIGDTAIDLSGYAKKTELPTAGTATPLVASGEGDVGSATAYAREDHVHPPQTDVTGNAGTADKLKTSRQVSITGGATAEAVEFDGSGDLTLEVTSVDGTKVTGTVPESTKATQDGNGAVIAETYATKDEVAAQKLTWQTF